MVNRTVHSTAAPVTTRAVPLPFSASRGAGAHRIVLGGRFGEEDEAVSAARLDRFVMAGGRFVDTAHSYAAGRSEAVIGRWLRHHPRAVAVVDKIGHPDEQGRLDLSPARLRAEAEISRDRLAAPALDVVLLHRDDPARPVDVLVDGLARLADEGLARQVGLSNWAVPRAARAVELFIARGLPPVLSYQFSLAVPGRPLWPGTRHAGQAILDIVRRHGVPLVAWAGQARGYFTGATELVDGDGDPFATPANERRRARCLSLARQRGIAPETVALAWSLHTDGVLPVVGARTLAELDTSMAAAAIDLDPGTVRWLAGEDE